MVKINLPEQGVQVEDLPICTECFEHAIKTRSSLGQMDLTAQVAIIDAQLIVDMEKCDKNAFCFGENGLPIEVQMRRRLDNGKQHL